MKHQRKNFIYLGFASIIAFGFFLFLISETRKIEKNYDFELVDPQMAPENIRAEVLKGYNIMLETPKLLPEYVGDWITCSNCHFAGGNTLGGENGGIPLVGVTKKYPRRLDDGKILTLPVRMNSCFEKSMNGKALPVDSDPMRALVVYLEWITTPAKNVEKMEWLGMKEIHSRHVPSAENGEKLYQNYCADCHGKDGEGQQRTHQLSYPPLWGPHSFNTAAGMNDPTLLSAFIYQNMPYNQPILTPEEALDIAAFVVKQPRTYRPD